MRCFIAVDLDSRLREKVLALQKELKGAGVSLTKPENLHFTLKFLSEVDVNTLGEVKRRMGYIAKSTKPFSLNVEKTSAFPSEKSIRVIWVGGVELFNLQLAVEDVLTGLFAKEKPVPHLTIARAANHDKRLSDFVNKNKDITIGNMTVNCIKLKKSTLTADGPVYEDIKVFELTG